MDVIIPESGSKKGRHLKLLAEINLDRLLLRGTKIKCNEQEVWVDFQYKKLALFCFYYRRVGHSERTCSFRKGDANTGKVLEAQYGDWFRTNVMREGYWQEKIIAKGTMRTESRLGREGVNNREEREAGVPARYSADLVSLRKKGKEECTLIEGRKWDLREKGKQEV